MDYPRRIGWNKIPSFLAFGYNTKPRWYTVGISGE
jgi:hypothetical protein